MYVYIENCIVKTRFIFFLRMNFDLNINLLHQNIKFNIFFNLDKHKERKFIVRQII